MNVTNKTNIPYNSTGRISYVTDKIDCHRSLLNTCCNPDSSRSQRGTPNPTHTPVYNIHHHILENPVLVTVAQYGLLHTELQAPLGSVDGTLGVAHWWFISTGRCPRAYVGSGGHWHHVSDVRMLVKQNICLLEVGAGPDQVVVGP